MTVFQRTWVQFPQSGGVPEPPVNPEPGHPMLSFGLCGLPQSCGIYTETHAHE